ncbi:hypothetical protein A2397_05550 [Candidatus Amesbacteria bacterium RIFOXYB1_FULL_44_23]|uniref:Uncharacterized protein n=1 Tax=Candidatus Amesbacteria bacterium RIFOXYB1_FULL_44_23 TaxID=1797263 RepID=A0A1F4ZPH9_9BACT|nr:MAG: hypothetical protein A2397_05550 [Candidatus Amesbacteria bacterium RIFOXYB1_FULL_44_23]
MLEETQTTTTPVPADPTSTIDLTGMINSTMSQVEKLKIEAGKLKEMLDDIFQNDPTYQAHDKAVKEASKIRGNTKKQILKMPQAADLSNKILELRAQIKERNQELSDYLQDYARTTGTNSFETEDGTVRQIIYTARLVKVGQ